MVRSQPRLLRSPILQRGQPGFPPQKFGHGTRSLQPTRGTWAATRRLTFGVVKGAALDEADFLAELEYRVRHASPEDLGHVVGPDGIILDP